MQIEVMRPCLLRRWAGWAVRTWTPSRLR